MKKSLQLTGIYGIIDEEFSGGCTNLEVASSMLARGVRVIQYREKTKPALYQYQQCLLLRQLTRQAKATFIVNDHVDIAWIPQIEFLEGHKSVFPTSYPKSFQSWLFNPQPTYF